MKRVLPLALLLGGSTCPGAIRNDARFWNMLTPAARQVLAQVSVYIEPNCWGTVSHQPFAGGRYDWETNAIELCGPVPSMDLGTKASRARSSPDGIDATDILGHPEILRHEALHALDRASNPTSIRSGFFESVPADLYEQAEALYPGWFRPLELWATLPLVVGWDFDRLPDNVAAYYAPWFGGIT